MSVFQVPPPACEPVTEVQFSKWYSHKPRSGENPFASLPYRPHLIGESLVAIGVCSVAQEHLHCIHCWLTLQVQVPTSYLKKQNKTKKTLNVQTTPVRYKALITLLEPIEAVASVILCPKIHIVIHLLCSGRRYHGCNVQIILPTENLNSSWCARTFKFTACVILRDYYFPRSTILEYISQCEKIIFH